MDRRLIICINCIEINQIIIEKKKNEKKIGNHEDRYELVGMQTRRIKGDRDWKLIYPARGGGGGGGGAVVKSSCFMLVSFE